MKRKIALGGGIFILTVLAIFSTQMSSFLISDTYPVGDSVKERLEVGISEIDNTGEEIYSKYQIINENGEVMDQSDWESIENSNNIGAETSQNFSYEFTDKITSSRSVLYIDFTLEGSDYNNTRVQSVRHYDESEGTWNDVTNKLISTYSKSEQIRLHFWGLDEGNYWEDAKEEEYQLDNYIEGRLDVGNSGTVGNSLNYIKYNIPENIQMDDINISQVGIDSNDWDKRIDYSRDATDDITNTKIGNNTITIELSGNYNIKEDDEVVTKFEGLNIDQGREESSTGKVNDATLDVKFSEKSKKSTWDTFNIRERDKVELELSNVENPEEAGTYIIRQRFLTHGRYDDAEAYKYRGREIDDREYGLTVDGVAKEKIFNRKFSESGVYEYQLLIGNSNKEIVANQTYDFKVYEAGDAPKAFNELENFFSSNFLDGFFGMFSFF